MESVLVTGATGLIGANICKLLRARDVRTTALVRPASDASELEALGVEIVRGDITSEADVHRAAQGVEVIVNSAALLGGASQDMEEQLAANHLGSVYCYDAALDGGRRVIELTTTPFLRPDITLTEFPEILPEEQIPDNPYAVSKGRAFRDGLERVHQKGEDIVFVIPGGTFGPSPCVERAMHSTSFNRLVRAGVLGRVKDYAASPIPWVRAEDVADATIRSIERGEAGVTYIAFGPDEPMTTAQFLNLACEVAGVEHRVEDVVVQPGDEEGLARYGPTVFEMLTREYPKPQFDNELTRTTLGYEPLDIRSSLEETVAWMRAHGIV